MYQKSRRGCDVLFGKAESPNVLREKLRVLIPELLELNGVQEEGAGQVRFSVRYQHEESGVATTAS